jgi:hypothetical protein
MIVNNGNYQFIPSRTHVEVVHERSVFTLMICLGSTETEVFAAERVAAPPQVWTSLATFRTVCL